MAWSKNIVELLEQNAFYNNGQPLKRESDVFILDILKEESAKGSTILDYACGTGRLYDLLKAENVPVIYSGYDSSEDMIEKAKEKFPDAIFTNKVPDKVFDVVVNIDMLQHSETMDEFKAKMKDVLATGKKVIFHFWYKDFQDFQWVGLDTERFPEIFPNPAVIINELLYQFGEASARLMLFPNCQPYKTAVIVVNQPEKTTVKKK
jgi:SAM-dependent methyltransferase